VNSRKAIEEPAILPVRRDALEGARDFGCNSAMEPPKRHQITVTARASFVPEQSDEQEGRYVFAYTISILNSGTVAARLISRHWIITDSDNQVQEVRGLGVVGEQPLLAPGQSFQYSSGAAIATPVGTMRGSYHMVAEDGTAFEASIPEFMLSMPRTLH
jgi:ApaG protein